MVAGLRNQEELRNSRFLPAGKGIWFIFPPGSEPAIYAFKTAGFNRSSISNWHLSGISGDNCESSLLSP